jgi:hypothetical protein
VGTVQLAIPGSALRDRVVLHGQLGINAEQCGPHEQRVKVQPYIAVIPGAQVEVP